EASHRPGQMGKGQGLAEGRNKLPPQGYLDRLQHRATLRIADEPRDVGTQGSDRRPFEVDVLEVNAGCGAGQHRDQLASSRFSMTISRDSTAASLVVALREGPSY